MGNARPAQSPAGLSRRAPRPGLRCGAPPHPSGSSSSLCLVTEGVPGGSRGHRADVLGPSWRAGEVRCESLVRTTLLGGGGKGKVPISVQFEVRNSCLTDTNTNEKKKSEVKKPPRVRSICLSELHSAPPSVAEPSLDSLSGP